jgi:hypothetical protein
VPERAELRTWPTSSPTWTKLWPHRSGQRAASAAYEAVTPVSGLHTLQWALVTAAARAFRWSRYCPSANVPSEDLTAEKAVTMWPTVKLRWLQRQRDTQQIRNETESMLMATSGQRKMGPPVNQGHPRPSIHAAGHGEAVGPQTHHKHSQPNHEPHLLVYSSPFPP